MIEMGLSSRPSGPAQWVVLLFAAVVLLGVILLVAFEPEVQTIEATELFARTQDAKAFLITDFLFVVLYAVLLPIAIWNFGVASGAGRAPDWIRLAVLLLLLLGAGAVDAIENTLLLTAVGSGSADTVDAAHALEMPKVTLFAAGALLALAALVSATRALRDDWTRGRATET